MKIQISDNSACGQINYDFSAVELVIDYFLKRNNNKINEIVNHPAYKLVFEHSKRFSSTALNKDMLVLSLKGKSTAFGFSNINERLSILKEMVNYLKNNEQKIKEEFIPLALFYLPRDYKPEVTVYFIIGGYNGIALNDEVAINIDWEQFRSAPQEIFLYLPHELFHIGFAHYQQVPDISIVKTKEDLRKLVMSFTMNEGLATLVTYQKRIDLNALSDYDYSILINSLLLTKKVKQFMSLIQILGRNISDFVTNKLLAEVLGQCSGDRLFYVVGCYMGLKIEQNYGREKLIELIKHSPEKFFEVFKNVDRQNI
ncbi:hypothetical protein KAW65_02710 [candidate division WOR-3 bacterium]|nr:hypothetical protein [candidate division WOR-3 bacterium]